MTAFCLGSLENSLCSGVPVTPEHNFVNAKSSQSNKKEWWELFNTGTPLAQEIPQQQIPGGLENLLGK